MDLMGYLPSTQRLLTGAFLPLIVATGLCASPVAAGQAEVAQHQRTIGLLQQSMLWIRHHPEATDAPASSSSVPASESAPAMMAPRAGSSSAAIPISSAAAREQWIGQKFFLRGEDHDIDQADRVRVGFETDRIPWVSNNLAVDGNWSTSQQPGDSTMDLGMAWRVPWGDNQLAFRGRLHEYENEVDDDNISRVGGMRQTLEIDLARKLYDGRHANLDASVITTDVTRRWYEDDDLTNEERRSYSLVRLDGRLESYLPWLDASGGMGLTMEGCVALAAGDGQDSCGEQLGAFQRYNLTATLQRQWLNMDWGLHGEYQFTPDQLPSWRYMEVGPGLMYGFGGQVLQGREGGWVRLDSVTRSRPLWSPLNLSTNLRFSLLRGWAEAAADSHLTSRASVAEVLWRISGESVSGGIRAGTMLDSAGPGIAATNVPDISVNVSWTL